MNNKKVGAIITIGKGDSKQIVSGSGLTIKIKGETIQHNSDTGERCVDLVFVIDTTGSMSDKIEGLLTSCAKFVEEFAALNLDHRLAIVAFGDLTVPGDRIEAGTFTDDIAIITTSLGNIPRFSGGGNEGESSLEALEKALALPFRPSAVKAIVLITDEPALQHRLHTDDMISMLSKREILAFVVSPPYSYYKEMASKSAGKWYQVSANTDLSDLVQMFRKVAQQVSQVVSDIYAIGNGSVTSYLQLKPPEK